MYSGQITYYRHPLRQLDLPLSRGRGRRVLDLIAQEIITSAYVHELESRSAAPQRNRRSSFNMVHQFACLKENQAHLLSQFNQAVKHLLHHMRSSCTTGPIASISSVCAHAVEARTPIVGVNNHAVFAAWHLGVFLLQYLRLTRIQVYRGIQGCPGALRKIARWVCCYRHMGSVLENVISVMVGSPQQC